MDYIWPNIKYESSETPTYFYFTCQIWGWGRLYIDSTSILLVTQSLPCDQIMKQCQKQVFLLTPPLEKIDLLHFPTSLCYETGFIYFSLKLTTKDLNNLFKCLLARNFSMYLKHFIFIFDFFGLFWTLLIKKNKQKKHQRCLV